MEAEVALRQLMKVPVGDFDQWYPEQARILAAESVEPSAACAGHHATPDEKYEDLRERYGSNPIGFVAELAKKNHERRIEHEILTSVDIPEYTEQGRALCLVARLAILAERVREWERYGDARVDPR